MLERVLKTISRYDMLPPGSRVLVAVSGGADSVCLLHLLRDASCETGATVAGVGHFNHKLRGAESDEDERHVATLAASFGLPFYRAEGDLRRASGNLEQAARSARRDFFLGLIRDGAATRIALGHTRDDQAETVLFRVLRGSGLAGLAGIHPVTEDGFVRPLVDMTRADVEEYLRAHNIPWREDSSNRDRQFARNRIRHDLLPQLAREWNPRIGETLAHLADLAYEEEKYWSRQGPVYLRNDDAVEFLAVDLASMPRAVARRSVRRAIVQVKGDLRGIDFEHIERILELAARDTGNGRIRIPSITAIRSFDWLRISLPELRPQPSPVAVTVPGIYSAPGGHMKIRFEMDETPASSCDNLRVELAAPLELRGWRPGDHYRPVGKSRDQKLKEMFQDARIPSWRRPDWPILVSEGKILWASKFGPAQEFAAGAASVKGETVLRISELSGVPR